MLNLCAADSINFGRFGIVAKHTLGIRSIDQLDAAGDRNDCKPVTLISQFSQSVAKLLNAFNIQLGILLIKTKQRALREHRACHREPMSFPSAHHSAERMRGQIKCGGGFLANGNVRPRCREIL